MSAKKTEEVKVENKLWAKLVSGRIYVTPEVTFHVDKEVEVSEELYDYLSGNEQFEVRQGAAAVAAEKGAEE
jgi:hypothetical protein